MRIRGALEPKTPFSFEEQPNKPGYALVRFYQNIEPYEEKDEFGEEESVSTGYEYDEYQLIVPMSDTIEEDIEADFDVYLAEAIANVKLSVEDKAKVRAIKAMSNACADVIIRGVDVEANHYSLSLEDQLNMISLQGMVQSGSEFVPYHADGEECRFYSAEEFNAIAMAATNHKLFQESYFNSLRGYIQDMTMIEDIESVHYGMEIPVEYQTDVLKQLLAQTA